MIPASISVRRAIFFGCMLSSAVSAFQAGKITQFGDEATWQHVSSSVTAVSFAGLGGQGSNIDSSYRNGIRISGVTFTGAPYGSSVDYLYIRTIPNVMFGPPDSDLGCPPPQVPCGNSGAGITVSLPAGVTSVGLNLGSFWPPGPVSIRFSNGQTFVIPNAPLIQNFDTSTVFAGFISTTPIDSFIVEAAGLPIIRGMSFGTYAPSASPFISPTGIVPIDSSVNIVAPSEWITIYGVNLATGSETWNGDFPTSLGGTTVAIDGKLAYLWYVSPYQINAQVPDEWVRGAVSVVVSNSLGTSK